jgi:hypothetical protein
MALKREKSSNNGGVIAWLVEAAVVAASGVHALTPNSPG